MKITEPYAYIEKLIERDPFDETALNARKILRNGDLPGAVELLRKKSKADLALGCHVTVAEDPREGSDDPPRGTLIPDESMIPDFMKAAAEEVVEKKKKKKGDDS